MHTVLRPSFFWDAAWHRLVVGYQCFGTTGQSHLQVLNSPGKMLGIGVCIIYRGQCEMWLVLRKSNGAS
jgi:hypothetical protein